METENQDKHECCMKKGHEEHKESGMQKYLMVAFMAIIFLMSLVQAFQRYMAQSWALATTMFLLLTRKRQMQR